MKKLRGNKDIIDKYEDRILSALNDYCISYKLIGTNTWERNESPRWMNGAKYDEENHRVYFKSTGCSTYFWVKIDEEDREEMQEFLRKNSAWMWDWFKKRRTNFLIEYHPTIDAGYEKFELK
tara:strand:- start:2559 stop:2924 length:366 start_codon:yes stop_codon:yes gene_type:complete